MQLRENNCISLIYQTFVKRIKGSRFQIVSIETLLPHVRKDAKTSRVLKAAAFWTLYYNDQRQGYETTDGRFIRDNNLSHVELTAPLVVFRDNETVILDGNHRILFFVSA